MRKVKIIKIDDQEITIKELRVRDIYELAASDEKLPMMERLEDALSRCSDTSKEKLMDMTPSELEELWAGFREVNSSFLSLAEKAGLGSIFETIKATFQNALSSNLQQLFAESSQQVTAE